jgi:hypothetical protein
MSKRKWIICYSLKERIWIRQIKFLEKNEKLKRKIRKDDVINDCREWKDYGIKSITSGKLNRRS